MKLLKIGWPPLVLLLAVLSFQVFKTGKKTVVPFQHGLQKLVYEHFYFSYDTVTKKDTAQVETFYVILGKNMARFEPKEKQLSEYNRKQTTIVKRLNASHTDVFHLYDFLNYQYCYHEKKAYPPEGAGGFHQSSVALNDASVIHGFTCQKQLIKLWADGIDTLYFIMHLTNGLQVADYTGSGFTIPFGEYGWQKRLDIGKRFVLRADRINAEGKIEETIRLKGMDENIPDQDYFRVPAAYKIYNNDSIPLKMLRQKNGDSGERHDSFNRFYRHNLPNVQNKPLKQSGRNLVHQSRYRSNRH